MDPLPSGTAHAGSVYDSCQQFLSSKFVAVSEFAVQSLWKFFLQVKFLYNNCS